MSYIMIIRTRLAIYITVKTKNFIRQLRRQFETIHDIAFIHAIVIAIIMTSVLYLAKTAENSAKIAGYLHDLACSFEATDGIPPSLDGFEKECLPR